MFLGFILMIVFLSSLPWVWINLAGFSGVAIRPSVLAALLLVPFYLWKGKTVLQGKYIKVLSFVLLLFIVWILPSYFNQHSHWNSTKVFSVFLYLFLAYFAANTYLLLSFHKQWKHAWPIVAVLFLMSISISFYIAFGSLLPNIQSTSSDEFIQNSLYANMFDPTQRGGKGIRHTMAIVPVLLLGMVVHNKNISVKLNTLVFVVALYLIFFTMSRAAWLSAFLIVLLVGRLFAKDMSKKLSKLFILGITGVVTFSLLMFIYPQIFNWFWNIIGDRVSDNRSTGGRLTVIYEVFIDMTFGEYLTGNNRISQYSPHNMMLDSFMQSGILGLIITTSIFIYVSRIYLRGLLKGGYNNIVAAVFSVPAFVRMFSAGSGMLHIAELFALIIAINIGKYLSQEKNNN